MRKYAPYLIIAALLSWVTAIVLLIALDPNHGAGTP